MRKSIKFINGEYYHIYNRGTDKRTIFTDQYDFERFVQSMIEFNSVKSIGSLYEISFRDQLRGPTPKVKKLVNIICFCINPNHFHMILEQRVDGGISEFIKRLSGGYAGYFNNKYKRTGTLFQGRFKAKHVNSNEYFLHLGAYVNLNNRVHRIKGERFRSSWAEYTGESKKSLCERDIILNQYKNIAEYKNFTESSLTDILERKDLRKEMEDLLLE